MAAFPPSPLRAIARRGDGGSHTEIAQLHGRRKGARQPQAWRFAGGPTFLDPPDHGQDLPAHYFQGVRYTRIHTPPPLLRRTPSLWVYSSFARRFWVASAIQIRRMSGYMCYGGDGELRSSHAGRFRVADVLGLRTPMHCEPQSGWYGACVEHLPSVEWHPAQDQEAPQAAYSHWAGSPAEVQGGMRSISPRVVWSVALSIACRAMRDGSRRSTCSYVCKRFCVDNHTSLVVQLIVWCPS